jgi:hypothetical protein
VIVAPLKFGGGHLLYRKNENALAGNNQGQYSGFLNTVPSSVVSNHSSGPECCGGEEQCYSAPNSRSQLPDRK